MAASTGSARRWIAVAALTVTVALGLIGCGAPSWNYVTSKEEHTYAKVPVAWRDVSAGIPPSSSVFGLDPSTVSWVRAYDADAAPSIDHATGTAATAAPTMVAVVFTLPEQARGGVSLDSLRDVIFPISERSRRLLEMQPGSALSGFKLFGEQTLTPGNGLRGVRSIFSYSINGGQAQVFDQTAYTNDDASKIYLIMVRCALDCFAKNSAEIDNVASSFTVREKP
ncbi:hypothetical protein ACQEVB_06720 [Pseudonocardia sp. CA-107938]|uniref:hypothetical protein n=1 Tax=Pseudonocardia sp. CA-107938 TaxID=3240021 RepID=UPI003D92BFB6